MELRSRTIHFQLVNEHNAEFILSLRTNDELNKYISKTNSSIQEQKRWIRSYKTRENRSDEFYFVIYRNDNNIPIGTVRLYDFRHDKKSFCWGSWVLNENKTKYSAIESAFLVYRFAFETLGFERSHFDVRKGNDRVISFHQKIGARIVSENGLDLFFEVIKSDVVESERKFSRFI